MADGRVVDPEGHTPLSLAEARNQGRCAEILHDSAPPSLREARKDRDVAAIYEWVETGPTLVAQGMIRRIAVNVSSEVNRETTFILAAKEGLLALVRQLVELGVDMTVKDKQGKTALAHALASRRRLVVSFLLMLTEPAEKQRLRRLGYEL